MVALVQQRLQRAQRHRWGTYLVEQQRVQLEWRGPGLHKASQSRKRNQSRMQGARSLFS